MGGLVKWAVVGVIGYMVYAMATKARAKTTTPAAGVDLSKSAPAAGDPSPAEIAAGVRGLGIEYDAYGVETGTF